MNNSAQSSLPVALQTAAQEEAQSILRDMEGVRAVVIATVDGFAIAHALQDGMDANRIAAMASSISAISQVVSEEAELGAGKRVTIEADIGFSVLQSVQRSDVQLVLCVVANSKALLAQVAYRCGAAAKRIAES